MKLDKAKTYVPAIVDLIFCVSGALCIFTGFAYLVVGNVTLATTGLGSGLLLLFAATIDKFESLKGLGLEAKTKALNQTIDEANQTLILLRQLAEITGKTLTSLVSKVGRSFTVKETHELSQEIKKNLTELKSDQPSIERALQPWVQSMCGELAERLTIAFNNDYYEVELSVTNQLQGISSKHDEPDAERDELIKLRGSIETHKYRSFNAQKWPAKEVLTNLREHVSTAPSSGEQLKQKHLASIESWAVEVDYLIKFSDLRSPQRWADEFIR